MVVKIKQESCCTVDIEWEHNQSVQSLEASHFRDVSPECVERVYRLFESGLYPSTARHQHLQDIRVSCKDGLNFGKKKADTSVVPRRTDFNYLYTRTQFCKETLGGRRGRGAWCSQNLWKIFLQFEKENPQATTSHHNIPLTIAIATPLMKRVHEKHRTRSSDMPVNFFTWTAMSSYVFLYYLLTF